MELKELNKLGKIQYRIGKKDGLEILMIEGKKYKIDYKAKTIEPLTSKLWNIEVTFSKVFKVVADSAIEAEDEVFEYFDGERLEEQLKYKTKCLGEATGQEEDIEEVETWEKKNGES